MKCESQVKIQISSRTGSNYMIIALCYLDLNEITIYIFYLIQVKLTQPHLRPTK